MVDCGRSRLPLLEIQTYSRATTQRVEASERFRCGIEFTDATCPDKEQRLFPPFIPRRVMGMPRANRAASGWISERGGAKAPAAEGEGGEQLKPSCAERQRGRVTVAVYQFLPPPRHRLSLALFPLFCSTLSALAEAWLESPFHLHAIHLILFVFMAGQSAKEVASANSR